MNLQLLTNDFFHWWNLCLYFDISTNLEYNKIIWSLDNTSFNVRYIFTRERMLWFGDWFRENTKFVNPMNYCLAYKGRVTLVVLRLVRITYKNWRSLYFYFTSSNVSKDFFAFEKLSWNRLCIQRQH